MTYRIFKQANTHSLTHAGAHSLTHSLTHARSHAVTQARSQPANDGEFGAILSLARSSVKENLLEIGGKCSAAT